MTLEFTLHKQIQLLDEKSLSELRLFVEFLLTKQQKTVRRNGKKTEKRRILADMEPIPIPVDNVIIDRADIYEDRF